MWNIHVDFESSSEVFMDIVKSHETPFSSMEIYSALKTMKKLLSKALKAGRIIFRKCNQSFSGKRR